MLGSSCHEMRGWGLTKHEAQPPSAKGDKKWLQKIQMVSRGAWGRGRAICQRAGWQSLRQMQVKCRQAVWARANQQLLKCQRAGWQSLRQMQVKCRQAV